MLITDNGTTPYWDTRNTTRSKSNSKFCAM